MWIWLPFQRKSFEEDRAMWLKHQFLNLSPFSDSAKPPVTKSKSAFWMCECLLLSLIITVTTLPLSGLMKLWNCYKINCCLFQKFHLIFIVETTPEKRIYCKSEAVAPSTSCDPLSPSSSSAAADGHQTNRLPWNGYALCIWTANNNINDPSLCTNVSQMWLFGVCVCVCF